MVTAFPCPVCGADQWQPVERFLYHRTDHTRRDQRAKGPWAKARAAFLRVARGRPRTDTIHCMRLTAAQKQRRRVLFDVWRPEAREIVLQSQGCGRCGMLTFAPRPDRADLTAKYRYLRTAAEEAGGGAGHEAYVRGQDRRRARRVYDLTRGRFGPSALRILDYGGGNGKLMQPYRDEGHACFLVDHHPHPLPGMVRLGDEIRNIGRPPPFDLILCSHVLEHVAEPRELLTRLADVLTDEGVLFAEVPLEVWAGIPIEADPVTHINFFTPHAFRALFRYAGFSVLAHGREFASYGASVGEVLWIMARRAPAPRPNGPAENGQDLDRFLHPSRMYTVKKILRQTVVPGLRRRLAAGAAAGRETERSNA